MQKIDLEEIKKINAKLKFSFLVQDLKSVSIKADEGKNLIAALQELPQVITALRNLHAAYAWSKGNETPEQTEALDTAYLALKKIDIDIFITKTVEQ